MLAESWELSSDNKQLKLNLRKGVQFHSGREFTSEDVKWNVHVGARPEGRGRRADPAEPLVLATSRPPTSTPPSWCPTSRARPTFDFFEFFNIVDSVTAEGPERDRKLVGTGPFIQTEWVQGDHLSFERNPNYWQRRLPYLDSIRVNIVRDPQSVVSSLEAGAIDIADMPPLVDFARLRTDTRFRALDGAEQHQRVWSQRHPAADRQQAGAQGAEPRRWIARAWWRSRSAAPASRSRCRGSRRRWPSTRTSRTSTPIDLEKARALLSQAGVSNLEFDIVVNVANAEWNAAAQIYQSSLANIGIKANIKPYETAAYLDQINNHRYTGAYVGCDCLRVGRAGHGHRQQPPPRSVGQQQHGLHERAVRAPVHDGV